MTVYDIEALLGDIETFMKANLNTKLTAISTDKNDGISLLPVDSNGYFFQTLNDKVTNYDPFVFYGLQDIDNKGGQAGIGPGTEKKYSISVMICVSDTGQDVNITKRVLRYSRALSELFETSWDRVGKSIKLKVQSLVPIPFTDINTSENFRVVGVLLEANLG